MNSPQSNNITLMELSLVENWETYDLISTWGPAGAPYPDAMSVDAKRATRMTLLIVRRFGCKNQ